MLRQIGVPRERFEADVAGEGFDAGVDDRVLPQIGTSSERAMALRTVVRLLVLVHVLQVRRVLQAIGEAHLAARALVRNAVIVRGALVRRAFRLIRESLIAELAHRHVPTLVQIAGRLVLALPAVRIVVGLVIEGGRVDDHHDVALHVFIVGEVAVLDGLEWEAVDLAEGRVRHEAQLAELEAEFDLEEAAVADERRQAVPG